MIEDDKVPKKAFFSQSRLYMAMQGCIYMLRVGALKSIWTFLKSPKKAQNSGTLISVGLIF